MATTSTPIASIPVNGGFVELEPSLNVVLRQPRVNGDDVVVTVTDIDGLRDALDQVRAIRDAQPG